MENQDCVADVARGVFLRNAEGVVVELEFGELFAGFELEISDYEVAGLGSRVVAGLGCYDDGEKAEEQGGRP